MKVLFIDSEPTDIPLYPTDTQEDVLTRLAVERGKPTVFFPSDFEWHTFLQSPDRYMALDLCSILPATTDYTKAYQIYHTIKKSYAIPIDLFTEVWITCMLSEKPDPLILKAIQFSIPFDWIPKFQGSEKERLENWWSLSNDDDHWVSKTAANKAKITANTKTDEKNRAMGAVFQETEGLPMTQEKEVGYIVQFTKKTTYTTGMLFNVFEATIDFPVARYKTFYKMFADKIPMVEEDMNDDNFTDFMVYNKEGDVNIHVKNTKHGLVVQALILYDNPVDSVEKVCQFLHIEDGIEDLQQFGMRVQFYIEDVCIDPSIFSDMVMNDRLFQKFLSVNDTDKISKQNKSVFIYFHDGHIRKDIDTSDILVGGWKRAFSRHGDLTASLICEPIDKTYRVLVRVMKSLQQNTVMSFEAKIAKLLKIYKDQLPRYEKLYKRLIPKFTQHRPLALAVKKIDDPLSRLITAEPNIFVPNLYGRNCQKVKPIIVDDPDVLASLPDDRKLLFPPLPYKTYKPRYYVCPSEDYEKEGVAYKYPGLKKIKKSDHPFGYIPCCYIENWHAKNKKITEELKKKITGEISQMKGLKKSIDHVIKTLKIIDNLGQMGVLPEPIETFFLCMDPTKEYFRVGVPQWDSFVRCLEYQHSQVHSEEMREIMAVRTLIAETGLEIGEQENYDLPIDQLKDMLLDDEYTLEPERFWRILENFYQVTIVVFTRGKDNKISISMPRNDRSWYRYSDPKRPIVAIYRHLGGAMDDLAQVQEHCELIIGKKFNNVKNYNFPKNRSAWQYLQEIGVSFFDGDHPVRPTTLDDGKLFGQVEGQWVDSIGKARIFFFTQQRFPGFLERPTAPLKIPIITDLQMPSSDRLALFLKTYKHRVVQYPIAPDLLFFFVKVGQGVIVFPSRRAVTTVFVQKKQPETIILTILASMDESEDIASMQQQIRLSSVVQDYVLFFLSRFMEEHEHILKDKLVEEWIGLFFKEYTRTVSDGHLYPPIEDIPPYFAENVKGLVVNKKVLLADAVKGKLRFFLQWYLTRREEEVRQMHLRREIPSYYQYTSDFKRIGRQMIYNSVFPFSPIKNYRYEDEPLDKLVKPLNEPFYYYNINETGGRPVLVVRVPSMDRAKQVAYGWHTQHQIGSEYSDVPDVVLNTRNGSWTNTPGAIGRVSKSKDETWLLILPLR